MAKQKVVLKLPMEDAKMRAKAMKCAVGLHGVESVSHDGGKITVVGDGIDSVALTVLLRKKMGYAELLTVGAVDEKKSDKKGEVEGVSGAKSVQQIAWPSYHGGAMAAQPPFYVDVRDPYYNENPCCIMFHLLLLVGEQSKGFICCQKRRKGNEFLQYLKNLQAMNLLELVVSPREFSDIDGVDSVDDMRSSIGYYVHM